MLSPWVCCLRCCQRRMPWKARTGASTPLRKPGLTPAKAGLPRKGWPGAKPPFQIAELKPVAAAGMLACSRLINPIRRRRLSAQAITQAELDRERFCLPSTARERRHLCSPRASCVRVENRSCVRVRPSGLGTVYSTSTIARKADAGGSYNVALIDLHEGVAHDEPRRGPGARRCTHRPACAGPCGAEGRARPGAVHPGASARRCRMERIPQSLARRRRREPPAARR